MRIGAVACLLIVGVLPGTAGAQVYNWTDDDGIIHYETGLDRVPPRYRDRARRLLTSPRPAPEPPVTIPADRTTTIPFTPGAPIFVNATINGAGAVTLILDTGAERTVLSPAALSRLGIPLASGLAAQIKGITGTSLAAIARVDSLAVGNAVSGPLLILVHDADLKRADGLLGRDFLGLFSVTIDSNASVVTITTK